MKIIFVQFFHVFLLPLLNSFCCCRFIQFLSFIEPIFAWNIPLVSIIFLKKSLVFPTPLFSSISFHWSLRKNFLSLLAILWNSAFRWIYLLLSPLPFASILFAATCKVSSDNCFAFFHFSWGWFSSSPLHKHSDNWRLHQGYGFSSGHVWMWELDCEESWAPKNWCFWTMVLEKTLESPSDCKEIQPVHSEGDKSWVFIGRTDAEAETPILWSPHAKSWLIGKDPEAGRDWGQEEKGMTEDEMAGWHHRLDGHGFE